MKWHALVFPLLISLISAANIRSIYLFKDVLVSNTTALKTSGFNSLIIFGVGVLANGSIEYFSNTPNVSSVMVADGGSYVGGRALSDKIRSFRTGTTSVNRVEICMNSDNIQALMSNPGPGRDTPIYKNFVALKEAWNLDAVNNDDEAIYDLNSTVTFARMLGTMDYTYTIVPYTNITFWASLKQRLGTLLDRTYLQCYDGGADNDPLSWQQTIGMKVVPLLWVTNEAKPADRSTVAQAQAKFAAWEGHGRLAGGGYWNDYDIEQVGSSYTAYGDVLLEVFP